MARMMRSAAMMRVLARWHIWLGWLAGVPILMWLATGLLMVARPIEEVRGTHLRIAEPPQELVIPGSAIAHAGSGLTEMRVTMQDGRAVAILTDMDGRVRRIDFASGKPLPPLDGVAARARVAREIAGGEKVAHVTLFAADRSPPDFRQPLAVWQVALADGTNVYVGRDTGEIEAVRTRWWRAFDFAWGLHIMDRSGREDTSHPLLIGFAALSLASAAIGWVLMFRRRKGRMR